VIDVEQRALGAFEQDALAGAALRSSSARPVSANGSIFGAIADSSASAARRHRPPAGCQAAAQRIVVGQQALDLVRQRVEVGEVASTRMARRPTLSS
jgi:hypothetical protein